jgi:hypothetical protein
MFCEPLVGPLQVRTGSVALPAACVIVTPWPPTVTVPLRPRPDVFAAIAYVIEPDPEPDDPAVIVSQAALLVAVHPHPDPVVTEMVPDDAVTAPLADVGDRS